MHNLTEEERHYEKYIDVAMELLTTNSDTSPSARALIERLGGSMTTANKAMRVFWGYVGRRLSYDLQYPDGMPLDVIKLMEKIMLIARETAKKELKAEWVKVDEHAKELEINKVTMEKSIESLSQALAEEKRDHATLQHEVESTKQQLAATQSQIITNQIKSEALILEKATLSTELSSYKRELENRYEQLRELREHQSHLVNEIKEKNERMIAIERQNQTLADRIDHHLQKGIEYKEALDQASKKIAGLENRNEMTQAALSERNTAFAKIEAEVGEGKRYCLKLEADLECSIQRHSHLAHQLSSIGSELLELRPLKLRIDEIMGQISDLRGERDRLIKLLDEKASIHKPSKKRAKVGAMP